eukprot:TRINITY_DN5887_c0_g1_i12.p1 TRINITY_DN5887_c0_g1~~TRINITY_DN5887_c0_g1_i12.p1  ORF type:complete len:179 (-),score=32.09 TRINITY_DN5887_c0_g1_i12:127-663(-)
MSLCDKFDYIELSEEMISYGYCIYLFDGAIVDGLFGAYAYVRDQIMYDLNVVYSTKEMYGEDSDEYKETLAYLGNYYTKFEILYCFPLIFHPFSEILIDTFTRMLNDLLDNESNTHMYLMIAFFITVAFFYIICIVTIFVENSNSRKLALVLTLPHPEYIVNNEILVNSFKKYYNDKN